MPVSPEVVVSEVLSTVATFEERKRRREKLEQRRAALEAKIRQVDREIDRVDAQLTGELEPDADAIDVGVQDEEKKPTPRGYIYLRVPLLKKYHALVHTVANRAGILASQWSATRLIEVARAESAEADRFVAHRPKA
jgi:hypothetical protein